MKTANRTLACFICLLISVNSVGQTLLPEPVIAALAQEISGETAKRNLEYIARHHRMRGSRGFRAAAEHIVEQLRAYGLNDARIEQFPAGGKLFYGTQKSRPPWDATFAVLSATIILPIITALIRKHSSGCCNIVRYAVREASTLTKS